MAKLILVRHANTKPRADAPNHDWPLTPEGLQRSQLLANRLRDYALAAVFTSAMSRAIKTGEIIASELGLATPIQLAAFNENDRSDMPYYESVVEFRQTIARFLTEKDSVVMGVESAETALARFQQGIDQVRNQLAAENIAVVSHGTVMALFLARCSGQSPVKMWHKLQALGMPSYVVLDANTLSVEKLDAV